MQVRSGMSDWGGMMSVRGLSSTGNVVFTSLGEVVEMTGISCRLGGLELMSFSSFTSFLMRPNHNFKKTTPIHPPKQLYVSPRTILNFKIKQFFKKSSLTLGIILFSFSSSQA